MAEKYIPVKLRVWRSKNYLVLKVPEELKPLIEQLVDNEGYVTLYIKI